MPDTPLRLGWEEWCALPGLNLPALKVKVDTGARTSALHAFDIEPFGPPEAPQVRFAVHPIPGRHDLVVRCTAPLHDRREVTSSNGETEYRHVILSDIAIGPRTWPVELTLTDRGAMAYRMLLGRQALGGDTVVVPGDSFCQPRLSYDVYPLARRAAVAPGRPLSIAILSREAGGYTPRRLAEEASARGHAARVIDTARCYMAMNALAPEVHYDGAPLPRFDAVIPRIGASVSAYGAALVRQFETVGTHCLNGSDGITSSRDRIHAHQILARYHIGMPATAFAASPKDTDNLIALAGRAPLVLKLFDSAAGNGMVRADTRSAAQSVIRAFRNLHANFLVQDYLPEAAGRYTHCLVLGGRFVAALERKGGGTGTDLPSGPHSRLAKTTRAERDTAQKVARAFKLGLAGVDLLRTPEGPKVLSVSATPGLSRFESATGDNIAAQVLDLLEQRLRPVLPRRRGR